jgi:nitrate/nitrite-specific signal transduction histidine kinase
MKARAKRLEGDLSVTSHLGKGTRIRLSWPAHRQPSLNLIEELKG